MIYFTQTLLELQASYLDEDDSFVLYPNGIKYFR